MTSQSVLKKVRPTWERPVHYDDAPEFRIAPHGTVMPSIQIFSSEVALGVRPIRPHIGVGEQGSALPSSP